MSEKRKAATPEVESTATPSLKPIIIHPRSIQRAINKIAGTLNNPEYQEQLTKLTQTSVKNSLQTLQKMSQLSQRVSKLDDRGWESLISSSIDDLMRTYLQFNSDLVVLLQKLSSKTTDILDQSLPSQQEQESAATK